MKLPLDFRIKNKIREFFSYLVGAGRGVLVARRPVFVAAEDSDHLAQWAHQCDEGEAVLMADPFLEAAVGEVARPDMAIQILNRDGVPRLCTDLHPAWATVIKWSYGWRPKQKTANHITITQ